MLQTAWILRIVLTQMQDLALGLVELLEVHMGSLLKPIKVPLDGIRFLKYQLASIKLVLSANMLRAHSIPLSM